jgi:hypothetical protein
MPKKYKITNAGSQTDSPDLVDCHIEEKADGTGYELVAKRVVLATSNTLTPPFTFTFPSYLGATGWSVTVDPPITQTSMGGTWSNLDHVSITGEGDSWTASGSGTEDPGDDEAKSAAAKQY